MICTIEQVELIRKKGENSLNIPITLDIFNVNQVFADTDEIIVVKHEYSIMMSPGSPNPLQNNVATVPTRGTHLLLLCHCIYYLELIYVVNNIRYVTIIFDQTIEDVVKEIIWSHNLASGAFFMCKNGPTTLIGEGLWKRKVVQYLKDTDFLFVKPKPTK